MTQLYDFDQWLIKCDMTSKANADKHVGRLRRMWVLLDERMKLYPNALSSPEKIEDMYFMPLYEKIVNSQQAVHELIQPGAQPGTIKAAFSSLTKFLRFSYSRSVYIGFTKAQMDVNAAKLAELTKMLRKVIIQ